jgi:hypothetical protein
MEITVTVSSRAHLGLAEAAIKNNLTIESLASDVVEKSGISYADLFKIGVVTSAAFIKRFKTEELVNILSVSETNPEFDKLISKLTEEPYVNLLSDEVIGGVNLLKDANLLADENRVNEILNVEIYTPVNVVEDVVAPEVDTTEEVDSRELVETETEMIDSSIEHMELDELVELDNETDEEFSNNDMTTIEQ